MLLLPGSAGTLASSAERSIHQPEENLKAQCRQKEGTSQLSEFFRVIPSQDARSSR
jgi:hypothetical protein